MDELYAFASAYLAQHPVYAGMPAPGQGVKVGGFEGRLVYRSGDFQVQLFAVAPHFIVPAHTHPNVDSFEVYIDGQIKFSHRGQFVFEAAETVVPADGAGFSWRMLRVKPEDLHGAVVGPGGARFLSIQHWLNGVPPDCVANDYSGPAMDTDHFARVTTGEPEVRRQSELAERDAL
jgi:quercetin dioxygenase-like cupin family protein